MYNYITFNMSVIGQSHITKEKICQDYSVSYYDEQIAIAVVCDGHGGNEYFRSDKGAKFACESALSSIKEFSQYEMNDINKNSDKILNQLIKSIIFKWNTCIYNDIDENNFTEEEISTLSDKEKEKINKKPESAYGTTLIAVAVLQNYWFCLQIGDGNCTCIYEDGEIDCPVPQDDKCMFNVTTSMCDSNAFFNFRHYFSQKLPTAIFISTDGIENSFNSQNSMNEFFKKILNSFIDNDFDNALDELKLYLPDLSKKGSGDDLSISAILNNKILNK